MSSRLRKWRKAHGLTQEDFAKQIGTTGPSVCRIEAGVQWPSVELIAAIEAATDGDVTVTDIYETFFDADAVE
jgi:transcriptional regulator with XRE-family HTH domain